MKSKKVTLGLLIFYLVALVWIILFKMQLSFETMPHLRNVNLIPFGASVIVNGKIEISEIIQNMLAFIPYGLFMHILWEEKPLWRQILPIICTSILLETLQFVFSIGASDITDVIMNSLGGIVGIFIAIVISKLSEKNWVKIINVISFIGATALTLFITVLLLVNR